MKKIILTILVLTAFSVSASAQATKYTSTIVQDGIYNINNGYPCPVANIDINYSVAAVKINAQASAFCLIDHTDFVNTPLPSPVLPPVIFAKAAYLNFPTPIVDLTINDLVVVNQYAFFCGTANGTWSFYGYFDINDLLAPSTSYLNIQFYMLSPGTVAAPATLNKLVAYEIGSIYKVVAIGDDEKMPYNCISKIVEITDATGFPSCEVVNMPFFTFPNNVIHKIFLDDIVLTDNYVAVVGHDKFAIGDCNSVTGTGYVWMSFGNKNNVVADICDIGLNPNYYFKSPSEVVNAVIGEALDGDIFAIAYVHNNELLNKKYTRLRVIDIPNISNPYSQQFEKDEKEDPIEMVFLKNIGMIELLQPIDHQSDFVSLNPYASSSYGTDILYYNDHAFVSLDRIDPTADYRFIATRNAEIYLQDRTISLSPSLNSCPGLSQIKIKMIDELPFSQSLCPLSPETNVLNLTSLSFTFTTPNIFTNCFSFE